MNERDITRAIMDYLLLMGAWVFKVHGHLGQKKGVPDILACHRGRFIAIEVKRPGGKLSEHQEQQLEEIRVAGGVALVAFDVMDVMKVFEEQG